ncbi:hypothetical protein [Okibacterium endophyticum]
MNYWGIAIIAVVAYLLGARAGRERYEAIVESVSSFWNNPDVKRARKKTRRQVEKAQRAAARRM